MRIEDLIISSLMYDEEFARKVTPHVKQEYFQERVDGILFDEISGFFLRFNTPPTPDVIRVQLSGRMGITEQDLSTAISRVTEYTNEKRKLDWLLEKTEKFCKDRAVFNAIMQSLTIMDDKDKNHNKEAIPGLLQDALSISFDTAVGHSYIDDAESRFDFYNRLDECIPFDIDMLNTITNGGLRRKTLTLLLAESGGGKSLGMAHMAAANLRMGLNVLYITLELAEERLAERIDANLLNVDINKIKDMGKDAFATKISNIAAKTHGRLFIKEYPTGAAHCGHFRGLIEELKVKQNFVPDVIYVDYLGICASSRIKMGGSVNSYTLLKSVSEELRALAIENNCPVVSAGQLNRAGFGNSDVDLTNTSESMGIVMSSDIILAMIRTEELDDLFQVMFKQLKNRFGDPSINRRFVVGMNRAKMKLYNLEPSAQSGIMPQATSQPTNKHQTKKTDDLDDLPVSRSPGRATLDIDGFKV